MFFLPNRTLDSNSPLLSWQAIFISKHMQLNKWLSLILFRVYVLLILLFYGLEFVSYKEITLQMLRLTLRKTAARSSTNTYTSRQNFSLCLTNFLNYIRQSPITVIRITTIQRYIDLETFTNSWNPLLRVYLESITPIVMFPYLHNRNVYFPP